MDKIYIVGDSYSYGFIKYFKYINSKYIKTHTFYAEYLLNLTQHMGYIRKLNEGNDTSADNKKSSIENIIYTVSTYKPDIMIYNFGQVDVNFSYFYNKVFGVPYNINNIINEYINIIKEHSKTCKKVYVINFLPLFVDTKEDLISEFKRLHIKDLDKRLNQKEINDIFNIEKYRKHLYISNKLLKEKLNNTIWKNIKVIYVNYNKYIYKDNYYTFKDEFYIRKKNRDAVLSITLDFHINASKYLEILLQQKLIPELNNIANIES